MTSSPPQVCCICLTADRQSMTDRAVRCFLRQTYTYTHRWMLIWDTGRVPYVLADHAPHVILCRPDPPHPHTIGELRNEANSIITNADVIVHWDSDDISIAWRLEEQVEELFKSEEVEAVGYNSMVFWDGSQAWEYRSQRQHYAVGTSLMYRRRTWARDKFPAANNGECTAWQRGKAVVGVHHDWRMLATLHDGNTASRVTPHQEWRRVEGYDDWARNLMEVS